MRSGLGSSPRGGPCGVADRSTSSRRLAYRCKEPCQSRGKALRVLVTGATGFVGSHTAAALCHAGHEVRVLARDPSRVSPALDPHGVTAEIVVGDMTDGTAVGAAIAGCDAVIHAAGEIGVDSGTGPVTSVNLDGARTVIACALG